ncbi:uncharacterized protein LOC116086225 [Mastomys coucha]|uniref:uncharacterized protein LOC116086225 n=1 Tax=Mastomys coucha TaxID=35658 RepID=UPI0012629898|nr:uncharacterized protein LOC116086225 [Mastomys coucha]
MAKRPRYIIDTEQHPETSPRGTRTAGDRGRREGQACGLRHTIPRARRPRADPAQPGWQSSGRGARVRAASPAGELEGEEQGAAESHGSAQQLRPLARHKRGVAQPAADPALQGRRRPGRAEGAGALGAATLVLGVLAVVSAAAAAASAFRHYMLPVAGFIPPLSPPRARGPGPARRSRTSQPAAPANPDSPRQPRRPAHRPSLRECPLSAKPRPLGPRPESTESARVLVALAAASSFHRSRLSCTDSACPSFGDCADATSRKLAGDVS